MDWASWQETLKAWSYPDAVGLGAKAWVRETAGKTESHDLGTTGSGDEEERGIAKATPELPTKVTTPLTTWVQSHDRRMWISELIVKGVPESVMWPTKSRAILKYRVNNLTDFFPFPPLLINVTHWLIHHIPGKEKSSSLLLLKVSLTGQYPVITNPANHNRFLLKDFKQIGGYYHLSGSFSTHSPFHMTDTLMVGKS